MDASTNVDAELLGLVLCCAVLCCKLTAFGELQIDSLDSIRLTPLSGSGCGNTKVCFQRVRACESITVLGTNLQRDVHGIVYDERYMASRSHASTST